MTSPVKRVVEPGAVCGFYTVLHFAERRGKHRLFTCRCACGTIRNCYERNLQQRNDSCGCQRITRSRECNTIHGEGTKGSITPEYRTWAEIKRRCLDSGRKSYPDYGGRGITICAEWIHNFPAFLAHVGRKPAKHYTIERIRNDGNYEPGNVRWATRKEQNRNTRASRWIEFCGETKTLAEWAELIGIRIGTLHFRLKAWWPLERALTEKAFLGKNGTSRLSD